MSNRGFAILTGIMIVGGVFYGYQRYWAYAAETRALAVRYWVATV